MVTLSEFITTFQQAITRQDASTLITCLSIHPITQDGPIQAQFNEPNDFDLYMVTEKFRPIIKSHLKLMKCVYRSKDIEGAFQELNEMVNHLIRAGDNQTNWINIALINSMNELIAVYKVKQQKYPEDISKFQFQDDLEVGFENNSKLKISSLESLANTINKAFKLSLNDKNLDLKYSKRVDIYYFLANLIRIYFKMNKLELAKSLEKALLGARFKLPNSNENTINKKYSIIYLYYSSLLSLDNGEFLKAEEKLIEAYDTLKKYGQSSNLKQYRQILLLLLPLRLYNHGKYPKHESFWNNYPELKLIYKDNLFASIIQGDIEKFNESINKFETIFLKNHLYLLIELSRQQCYLNLFRKTCKIIESLNDKQAQKHIIPINGFQLAYQLSSNTSQDDDSLDQVECLLATLITSGKIKGYLSHTNRCIVLSKNNAFPRDTI